VPNVTVVLSIGKEFYLLSALKIAKKKKRNWKKGGKSKKVASIVQTICDISCLMQCISYILIFIF